MAEDVIAIFPASEIWGLNRRWPCLILLSDHRLVVVRGERKDGARGRIKPPTIDIQDGDLDEALLGKHYSLPFDRIRWVEVRPAFTSCLMRVQTHGGSYRFRMRRRQALRLEGHLRRVLGDRVRRADE